MEENKINKSTKIKIIVITVLIFLVSIAGVSYAFFTIQVSGNEEASSITVTAANLKLTYTDTLVMQGTGIYPGWYKTKTISVYNNGTDTVVYDIIWRDLLNQITNNELVISATCSASSGSCPAISETVIPTKTTEDHNIKIKEKISISSGVTHTYTVTVRFKELNSAQDYNQGKTFRGTLNIDAYVPPAFELVGIDDTTGFPVVRSVSVPSEEFYVISDTTNSGINYNSLISSTGNIYNYDSSKTVLLSKNILYVGHTGSSDGSVISPSASGYGLQTTTTGTLSYNTNESKNKVVKMSTVILKGNPTSPDPGPGDYSFSYSIGSLPFSGSSNSYGYWDPDGSGINSDYGTYTNYANNIYDTEYITAPNYSVTFYYNAGNANYSIAYYVEEYIETLGIEGAGRLLTYPEANAMNTTQRTNGQYYWLGSAYNGSRVWSVSSVGYLSNYIFDIANYSGVRPVIVVSTSDISA